MLISYSPYILCTYREIWSGGSWARRAQNSTWSKCLLFLYDLLIPWSNLLILFVILATDVFIVLLEQDVDGDMVESLAHIQIYWDPCIYKDGS